MKLKDWALANDVHPQTAYRWFRDGVLPVPAERVGPKTIMVFPENVGVVEPVNVGGLGLYSRVSSHDQKADLIRQADRLQTWASVTGMPVVAAVSEVSEVGSGMNGARPKLRKLLENPLVTTVVVEHRDRLGRMNTELIEAALAASGRRLVVVDPAELDDDDLVRDMTEVLTSFCARLYGRRSAVNRARAAVNRARAAVDAAASDTSAHEDELPRTDMLEAQKL